MKKSKLETAETRRRIVRAAAAEFRRNGIHATGLCELMAAAGLTHGGFYRHFDSKDQLVAEACAAGMEAEVGGAAACPDFGKGGLKEMAASYLSTVHRDNPGEGCLLAGLGSELARSGDKTRAAASAGVLKLAEIIAAEYSRTNPELGERASPGRAVGDDRGHHAVTDRDGPEDICRHPRLHQEVSDGFRGAAAACSKEPGGAATCRPGKRRRGLGEA